MLTEKTVYSTTIAANGEIIMEEILQIWKDDGPTPYVEQIKQTHMFSPGDDPSKLPGYGPALAKAVWSQELVEAYQRAYPPEEPWEDEVMESPIDEVEDPPEDEEEEEPVELAATKKQ